MDNLVNLYFTSVGRNSKLLLNVPPTRDGLLHDIDVDRLTGMRAKLEDMFRIDVAKNNRLADASIDLRRETTISISELREDIANGQTIAGYKIEGSIDKTTWQTLATGTTIGYCKLDRFAPVSVRYVRLTITDSVAPPRPIAARFY